MGLDTPMHRLRSRKAIVLFCIGVAAFWGLSPMATGGFAAILTPLWVVCPAIVIILVRRANVRCAEQPASRLSRVLFRAPPTLHELA
jgi:hypothetical protein